MTAPRIGAERGRWAEELVAARLVAAGWQVLGRGVHAGRSELDLVAVDPGPPRRLVVVEVRCRSSRAFGLPEETLDARKQAFLRRGVARLLEAGRLPDGHPLPRLPIGLDLVVVEPSRRGGGEPKVRHHRDVLGG
ncbi:MAG TPA: YraN family protein [Candidatus Limnocylindrales bacterium]